MTTKWNTRGTDANAAGTDFAALLRDEYVVIFLQGKNLFGDRIYSYLKVAMPDIARMVAAMKSGEDFNPGDFGSVVAAGQGEPSSEIRQEMASTYKLIDPLTTPSAMQPIVQPQEKKSWDDY